VSFTLQEYKERGIGYVLVKPGERIFSGSSCGLKIKLRGHSEGNLGEDGWQVAEFIWNVEIVAGQSGVNSVVLGPHIVKHLKQNHNYIFEFENEGVSFVEIIPWRGIRPIARASDEIPEASVTPLVIEPAIVAPAVSDLPSLNRKPIKSPSVLKCAACGEEIVSSMERCPWCNTDI
jgi:hypothetical protein